MLARVAQSKKRWKGTALQAAENLDESDDLASVRFRPRRSCLLFVITNRPQPVRDLLFRLFQLKPFWIAFDFRWAKAQRFPRWLRQKKSPSQDFT